MTKRARKKAQRKEPSPLAATSTPMEMAPLRDPWAERGWIALRAALIVAAVAWIYGPSLHGSWLWDDDTLISKNALVHDPYGIFDIWLAPSMLIDFFPVTVSVDWLLWQLWPGDTFPFHLTNVILHACSCLLVWHLFRKLGLRLAWIGGLIFAVHPILVESVAWMAELKNTLSMPPFLLAMCAWIDYKERGKIDHYLLSLALFLVAMLCKTSMVMFPFIILLYAWWKQARVTWRDLRESVAFFAVSLAVGLALIAFLRHGVGEETIPLGGFLSRMACAGISLSFYFSKCFLPVGLLPIYPQWVVNPPTVWQFLPWPVFAGAIYWLWRKRAPWARTVLFGWGFFLLNLLPFVGFRAISFMRFGWVMDHFLYVPILGLLGLTIAALDQAFTRLQSSLRPMAIGAIALVLIAFAVGGHRYAKAYANSIALWSYAVNEFPGAWPGHNDLGNALMDAGRSEEAETQYKLALELNPGYPEAHNNLGIIYARLGRFPESIEQFQLALQYCPDLVSAQENLAKIRDEAARHRQGK